MARYSCVFLGHHRLNLLVYARSKTRKMIPEEYKWQMLSVSPAEHHEWSIDLRQRPWRIMLLQDAEAMKTVVRGAFTSRK